MPIANKRWMEEALNAALTQEERQALQAVQEPS
jgi:hypothetical protein